MIADVQAATTTPVRIPHRVFAIQRGNARIAAVPACAEGWRDTWLVLGGGGWRDLVVGATYHGAVSLRDLWAAFPIALLVRA